MHRLRTVTSFDVSAVAGHHAMPAALLLILVIIYIKCLLTVNIYLVFATAFMWHIYYRCFNLALDSYICLTKWLVAVPRNKKNIEIIISILFYPITLGGRRGTTDEFATIPFHLGLFSAALVELAKSIPVHSLILSSHLFFCLPLFLFPFTVPCRIVFAKPEDLETWPNHLSFRFLTRVRGL